MGNNEKIKAVRAALGMTLEEFSSGVGVGKSLISMVEKGTKPATARLVRDVVRVYKVNQVWWDTGDGDMFEVKEQPSLVATAERLDIPHNPVVLNIFDRLSPEDQVKHLQAMLKDLPPLDDED